MAISEIYVPSSVSTARSPKSPHPVCATDLKLRIDVVDRSTLLDGSAPFPRRSGSKLLYTSHQVKPKILSGTTRAHGK